MVKDVKTLEESHKELVKQILEKNPKYHLRYCIKIGSLISLGMTLTNPNVRCWECLNHICNSEKGVCDPI